MPRGGARPGAGRKPKPKPATVVIAAADDLPVVGDGGREDMLSLLIRVALGQIEATPLQVRAAIAAVQYTHTKKHDGGKKDEQQEKARQAATAGRFVTAAPPRLVASR